MRTIQLSLQTCNSGNLTTRYVTARHACCLSPQTVADDVELLQIEEKFVMKPIYELGREKRYLDRNGTRCKVR